MHAPSSYRVGKFEERRLHGLDLISIVWAGLAGAVGGGFGALISRLAPEWGRGVIVAICVALSIAASRFVSPYEALNAVGLQDVMVRQAQSDRAALEAELATLPDSMQSIFATFEQHDPDFYDELLTASTRAAREGGAAQVSSVAHELVGQRTTERLGTASDSIIADYLALTIEQFEVLRDHDNQLCMLVAGGHGGPAGAEYPQEFMDLSAEAIALLFESAPAPGGEVMEAAAAAERVNAAILAASEAHSPQDMQAALTALNNPDAGAPAGACEVFLSYVSYLFEGPSEEIAPLWRALSIPAEG